MRWILFLLSLALLQAQLGSITEAAEVCTDKGEFTRFLQVSSIERNKNKVHEQKAVVQAKLIAELKAHISDQDKSLSVCDKYKFEAERLIEDLAAHRQQLMEEQKDWTFDLWMERGKGFAVGVGLGVLYFIVK